MREFLQFRYSFKVLCIAKRPSKKKGSLALAHLLDERFHMAEVTLQSSTTRGSQFVFGFWQPAFEIFRTRDISGFFEFARVDAEIAVGCIQQALKITEAQSFIRGERADDAEAQALVDQTIQIRSGTLCLAGNILQACCCSVLLSLI